MQAEFYGDNRQSERQRRVRQGTSDIQISRRGRAASEDEVFIDSDGLLYDIEIGHEEEKFDGFHTAFPACLTLKPKQEEYGE